VVVIRPRKIKIPTSKPTIIPTADGHATCKEIINRTIQQISYGKPYEPGIYIGLYCTASLDYCPHRDATI
jgi:hypothetical protein